MENQMTTAKKSAPSITKTCTKKPQPKTTGTQVVSMAHSLQELKASLQMIVTPDFSTGRDYWPKMDHRLMGKLPDLAKHAILLIDILEAAKDAD